LVPSEAENDESHQASGEEEQGAERYTDEPVRRSRHVDPIQTAFKNARVAKVQKIRLTRWRYGQIPAAHQDRIRYLNQIAWDSKRCVD
jgi:hypothetical protein